jgi:hypothetical protein
MLRCFRLIFSHIAHLLKNQGSTFARHAMEAKSVCVPGEGEISLGVLIGGHIGPLKSVTQEDDRRSFR